jgi:hypothetical protein
MPLSTFSSGCPAPASVAGIPTQQYCINASGIKGNTSEVSWAAVVMPVAPPCIHQQGAQ